MLESGRSLVVALAGALLAVWLHVPLPWFVGALAGVALYSLSGHRLAAPAFARDGGQWSIGVALGLSFTPAVVSHIDDNAPWVLSNTL